MIAFCRALLVWLLVAAVPAQAGAAASMAHCDLADQGRGPSASSHRHDTAVHMHGASGWQSKHEHAGDHSAAPIDDVASAAAGEQLPDPQVSADNHKCSACASCCSASAIPSSMRVPPTPDLSDTEFLIEVPSIGAFVVDGPDRPPRLVHV